MEPPVASSPTVARLLDLDDDAERFRLIGDFVRQERRVVQAAGEQLIASTSAKERALGADILGQLATVIPPARGEIAAQLLAAMDPKDEGDVVASFAMALGHAGDARARGRLVDLAGHPDSSVRFGVAFALSALGLDAETVAVLHLLANDADADVRDWATFALAESDLRDEETRRTLLARSGDPDRDTRAEAIYGLARRGDPKARELIELELASPSVGALILRARDELEGGAH